MLVCSAALGVAAEPARAAGVGVEPPLLGAPLYSTPCAASAPTRWSCSIPPLRFCPASHVCLLAFRSLQFLFGFLACLVEADARTTATAS